MIKSLGARLASRGKIKIGGLGESRKSKQGNDYRLPVKYDHFVITSNVRSKEGDLEIDSDIMQKIGTTKELDVVLFGNSIEDVYDDWYAFYDGKKAICRGNGETATFKGDKATYKQLYGQLQSLGGDEVQCLGDRCPLFKKEEDKTGCKLNFILRVILIDAPSIGGVYELRSTSVNSALAMRASIAMLLHGTGGHITGVPLKLKLSPKTVQVTSGQSTIYVTHLEYPGSFLDLKRAAIEQQKQVIMLDHSLVDTRKYQEYEDEHPDEIAAVTQEFYPVESEPIEKTSRMETIVGQVMNIDMATGEITSLTGAATPAAVTHEVKPEATPEAKPETKSEAKPANYKYLQAMQIMKTAIGEEWYYKILKEIGGVAHCNEITGKDKQKQVYNEMKKFMLVSDKFRVCSSVTEAEKIFEVFCQSNPTTEEKEKITKLLHETVTRLTVGDDTKGDII